MRPSPRAAVVRRTAHERQERQVRIMAMVRSGFSYEAIAREERLSSERIRRIVVAALRDKGCARIDHTRVQIARLDPALRLVARSVENGKTIAIPQLLRVLERLDKYDAVVDSPGPYANSRERLLAKLDRAAARLGIGAEMQAALRPPEAIPEGNTEGENLDELNSEWKAS